MKTVQFVSKARPKSERLRWKSLNEKRSISLRKLTSQGKKINIEEARRKHLSNFNLLVP